MTPSHFLKLQFLLLASLLIATLFESASCCGRRRHSHRRRHHYYHHYGTTTERYYGKRSVDDNEFNEIGYDLYESSNTNCGKRLCPKMINYPMDEIIDAVDRLQSYLRSGGNYFIDQGISHDHFVTSERSKTLSRRPRDHWYFSDLSSGCKQHAHVNFPRVGNPIVDHQNYYVVNVPNLRQSFIEYNCVNVDQACPKDRAVGASDSIRLCQQKYGMKKFVVLPMNKRHFDVEDFQVREFYVPDSCTCFPSTYQRE
ncbi:uncharacterized protein LOC131666593 [Phymastichus coffea]|uniref:uncharacterized protein LOC131666593 n=1 Tax=Phymastichus coffea TaxID=108790 RepID=UPI00273B2782|nr:uncharacterized protein LOC131666593 [Phymastichus coffea]